MKALTSVTLSRREQQQVGSPVAFGTYAAVNVIHDSRGDIEHDAPRSVRTGHRER